MNTRVGGNGLAFWSAAYWNDRGTVPVPVEDASDSAWAEFEACCDALDARVRQAARVRPDSRPLPAVGRAARLRASDDRFALELGEQLTVDDAMQVARKNDRVCPLPAVWGKLYQLLPVVRRGSHVQRAAFPIERRAWSATTDLLKRLRLREQMEWAEAHETLERVHEFLLGLREPEWHHHSPAAWPTLATRC